MARPARCGRAVRPPRYRRRLGVALAETETYLAELVARKAALPS